MGNRFIPDRRWWPQGLDPFLGTGSVVPKVLLCACPFLLPHLASLAANATCGCYTWFRVAAVRLQQVFIYRFAFGGCLCTSMCLALVPRFVILVFLVRVFVFFFCVFPPYLWSCFVQSYLEQVNCHRHWSQCRINAFCLLCYVRFSVAFVTWQAHLVLRGRLGLSICLSHSCPVVFTCLHCLPLL